jgi:hypothetical protein
MIEFASMSQEKRGSLNSPRFIGGTLTYYIATVVLAAIWSMASLHFGPASALGAFVGNLLWPVVIAGTYWLVSGRTKSGGKVTSARIAFWCELLIPPLLQSVQHVQR